MKIGEHVAYALYQVISRCVVRVGTGLAKEPNYLPRYSQKFALTPGVQALKLSVVHESLPTLFVSWYSFEYFSDYERLVLLGTTILVWKCELALDATRTPRWYF